MPNMKAWTTKEEVLKDLARASGKQHIHKDNLAEGYLVIGDAPPPVMREAEDAEMQLLFGEAANGTGILTEEYEAPDLAGIQQMIRMMQDFNSAEDDDYEDAGDAEAIAISKVSRLNPNVPEFIPKGPFTARPITNSNNNCSSSSKSYINEDTNLNVVTQTVFVKTEEIIKGTEESIKEIEEKVSGKESGDNNDTNLDNTNIVENKYEEIATTLKNQISDAAKSESFEYKKQKNVAIATLLKLYSKNNPPKKSEDPIKLITPEYFEGKKECPSEVKVVHALDVGSTATATSSTPEPKDSSTTLPSYSTLSTSSSSTAFQPSTKIKADPEIKKSIDKVSKWLGEPTKGQPPIVCLGPIPFKRKEPMKCKSPISDSSPKSPLPNTSQMKKYQPSQYAADLGKKYLERSKAIEEAEKDVNWVNLDTVLKRKDLEIAKKRSADQASTSS